MINKSDINYRLYLVTDSNLIGERDFFHCIEEAILGGVTMVQLREKNISSMEFYKKAQKLKALTEKYHVPLIINDRLDIALSIDADGLHIGQDDLPLAVARRIFGDNKIIGVSVSNIEEAKEAEAGGADYLGVGAMFPTDTKKDARHVSLDELRRIKSAVKIPVIAIGGLNESNTPKTIDTGIDGIAIVSAILGKPDIRKTSKTFLELAVKRG